MRVLICLIVLSNFVIAQYDSTMYDLINTTYERSFDSHIIYKYLHSNSKQKTNAAILSLAQSEDTSFVPKLLQLDLNKYGSEVCFALSQIGACNQSISFLWKYLYDSPPPETFPKIFFAIGKIGDENDLKKLVDFYNLFDGPIFPYVGISEAIQQFQIRGIKSDDAKLILENEALSALSSIGRIKKALFALSRFQNFTLIDDYFQGLLKSGYAKDDEEFRQCILLNVKDSINVSFDDLVYLGKLDLSSVLTKINFVKALHFFHFQDQSYPNKNLELYFKFLYDKNPNVSLQSAISIKNLKGVINDSSKLIVKNKIDSLLFDSTKSLSFKGELFLSRFELFGGFVEHQAFLGKCTITSKYFLQFYAKNSNNEEALKRLTEYYYFSSCHTYTNQALEEIIKIKDAIRNCIDYENIILFALNSNSSAPSISIAADGIDSIFIVEYANKIKEIILNQIETFKDNPNYLEATISLINLAEKIDNDFYNLMIAKTKTSKLYSIRKFLAEKTGTKVIGFKELYKFEDIWDYTFKYKQATIKTSKGKVVIKFDSEIAPISVANFSMLADKNYYNGITFHRVVPGFVIQAGDPTATGWGGPGYDIVSEFSDTDFRIGYVGMASAGKDTEGSQFFIMQGSYPHLDSRYTLFAKVVKGMEVVYNITEEDKIITIELN